MRRLRTLVSQFSRKRKSNNIQNEHDISPIESSIHQRLRIEENVDIKDNVNTRNESMEGVHIDPINISDIYAGDDSNWNEWIPAKETLNSFAKDWLLDWLKYHHPSSHKYIKSFDNSSNKTHKSSSSPADSSNKKGLFTEYILEQGNIFENKVINLIKLKMGNDSLIHINGEKSARSKENVLKTHQAMMNGIPFIHSGVLHNPENKTYGIPDLIVRSDWINKLFQYQIIDTDKINIPAPSLRSQDTDEPPNYHYLIVDVKFSTLHLRADGIHLLNSGLTPGYKSQLLSYNRALSRIQSYNPQKTYILGRKWEYTTKGISHKGKGCLEKLGVIDYTGVDKHIIKETDEALEWIRTVRSEEARSWNIYDPYPKDYRLRPNMCNKYDAGWHSIKKEIAEKTSELTDIWMVGVKNRKIAFSNNVYRWDSKECNAKALGVKGNKTAPLVNAILEANQPHSIPLSKIIPEIISNNFMEWQNPDVIEFYVDFETVNNISANINSKGELDKDESSEYIFMIGVGYNDPYSGEWKYKDFTVKKLEYNEEYRICKEFCNYIRQQSIYYALWDIKCIHWAPAERIMWNRAIERHPNLIIEWDSCRGEWFDLLHVFKSEPIAINGSLNFSLKNVAKAFKQHGFIQTEWNSKSGCLDGQDAMIGAFNANLRGGDMRISPEILEIKEYNEVDVKVLSEILKYLRENHIE